MTGVLSRAPARRVAMLVATLLLLAPGGAGAVPAPDLPAAKRCIGEAQVIARTNIPGRFITLRGREMGTGLAGLSDASDRALPRGDRLLVFVASAPYRAARRRWPEGSGVFFLMRDGCMVWHRRLPPDSTEPLIDSIS